LKLASHAQECLRTGIGSIKSTVKTMSSLVFKVEVCKSSSPAVYMHIMYSPFLLHPQSTPSQVTHMVIISVSRIQILAAGVTLHSIICIKIFISGILNLKIHHSASQHIPTLHHDKRRMWQLYIWRAATNILY